MTNNQMANALQQAGVTNTETANAPINTYEAFEQAADKNLAHANGFTSGRQMVCRVMAAIIANGKAADKLSLGAAVKRSTKADQNGKWSMYSKEYGSVSKLVNNLQQGVEVKGYTLDAIIAGTQHFEAKIPTGTIAAKKDDALSKARKLLGITKAEQTKRGLTDDDVLAEAKILEGKAARAEMLADIPAIIQSVTNGLHFLKTENPAEFQKVLAIFASDFKKPAKEVKAA